LSPAKSRAVGKYTLCGPLLKAVGKEFFVDFPIILAGAKKKTVGKDVLCRLPSRWHRKAGGKGGCLAGGKEKLVAKVTGH